MSEVPSYELLFDDYIVSNLYSQSAYSFPMEYQDSSKNRSFSPTLSLDQNKDMFFVGPLTPPNEPTKNDEILRRMSDAQVFNMFDKSMFDSAPSPSPTPLSPATTQYDCKPDIESYPSFNQGYVNATNFMGCSPKSEFSDGDNDYHEKLCRTTSSVSDIDNAAGDFTAVPKPVAKAKRKTRLCALTLEEKSERRKKQNRLAASRCRKKKQDALSNIKCTANSVQAENDALKNEIENLKQIIENMKKEKMCASCRK